VVSKGRGKAFGVYCLSKNCYGLGDSTMKGEVCPGRVFWGGFRNSWFRGMGNNWFRGIWDRGKSLKIKMG